MNIREATQSDNEELQQLQARCPQGTTLVVSTVNTPDFFARVKAYNDYKVYVAIEDNRIVGSAACALRKAIVNGKEDTVGHIFQAFVDPDYRGRRIAGQMNRIREEYLRQQKASLAYSLIIEGNVPSMHYITREGFRRYRTLVMPVLLVFKHMPTPECYKIRTATADDLPKIAGLLNETWQDCGLYEPKSPEEFLNFVTRTPGYEMENLFILEEGGNPVACLGYWDWSRVTRITVERMNSKMKAIRFVTNVARHFKPMPVVPCTGAVLNQIMLTPVAFNNPKYLTALLRHINNQVLYRNIGYIHCICERGHSMLSSMQGFTRLDTAIHVYIKYLRDNVKLGNKPLFIDGIDL